MFALHDTKTTGPEPTDQAVPATIPSSALDWAQARCRDEQVSADNGVASLTALFFSEQIPEIRVAKAICADCALAEPCLEGALERREPWGVWGGQLFQNGKVLAVKRPRGRPPKDPARQVTA